MANTPPSINGSDPSIQRQIDRQTASITGKARTAAPIISGDEVVYPRSTTSTSNDAVTITTSVNNDSGDITTVYSTKGQITVNPVNQTINQYTSVNSGVTQIIAGEGVIIDSTTGNGTGVVTINATAGGGNGDYGNSNVANYLPTYTGNVGANWIIADYISGNANPLFNIPGSNVVGTVPNATAAGTVTTAAQPNITSVGTLTGLNVSGNATISGNLTVDGNLVYVNVDTLAVEDPIIQLQTGPNGAAPASNSGKDVGTALNYYDTQARVAFMGWDTSNAEFGLASRASINSEVVTFDTYGNLRVGNMNAVGNVNANYFVGVATNVSVEAVNNNYSYHMVFVTGSGDTSLHMDNDDNLQYDPAEGVMTVTRVDMDYLSVGESVISSLVPLDSLPLDLGSNTNRWRDLYLSNSTIYLGNATISSNGNSIVVDSITINDGNIGTIGNIASINLDGSSSNVLYGNGVFAPVAGGGGNLGNLQVTGTTVGIANGASETAIVIGANNSSLTLDTDSGAPIVNLQVGSTDSQYYEESFDYTSGTWVVNGLEGTLTITGYSPSFETFLNGLGQYQSYTITVNGSETTATNGYSYGGGNATFYTLLPPGVDPTNVSNIVFNVVFSNKILMDPDEGDMGIYIGDFNFEIQSQRDIHMAAGDDFNIRANDGFEMRANSNFDITTDYNNTQQNWSFLSTGNLDIPGNINFAGDPSAAPKLNNFFGVTSAVNFEITTNTAVSNLSWTFDNTGNLILAGGNSVIQSIANSSLDPLNPNVSTMVLTPDQGYSYQALVLDPTAPGHIHLRGPSYSGNIDEPAANLFLGGESSSFEVGASYGSAPNVYVHSGGNTWTFDTTGTLTVPTNGIIQGTSNLEIISGTNGANGAKLAISSGTGNVGGEISIIPGESTVGDGPDIVLLGGLGNTKGGDINLYGGVPTSEDGSGGFVRLTGGSIYGNGIPGYVKLFGGDNNYFGNGGDATIAGGYGASVGGKAAVFGGDGDTGGAARLEAGGGYGTAGGPANVVGGTGFSCPGGNVNISGGTGFSYPGGNVNISGGFSTTGFAGYGNVYINTGGKTWTFDNTGNLTLPDNTLAINFANNSSIFGNVVQWSTAPVSNTSAGTAGQAAYDSGGNLFVCVATNTWAKFSGTTSW